jgi:hypothetical protein
MLPHSKICARARQADLKIGHCASLKAAATFLTLHLPVALRLVLVLLALPVPRARERELAALLLARARFLLHRVLLGAGRASLRRFRRRASGRCCERA